MKNYMQEQLEKFKNLSHEDKMRKVKGILNILGSDSGNDISSLRETIEMFENDVSDEELEGIYQSILELMEEFENNKNYLSE